MPAPPRSTFVYVFIALCLSLIWYRLGSLPLNGRSEGRYAVVSMNMAQGSGWLVPMFQDRPHLTKPPLTYWLEASCIRVFGLTEFAVRLPSAVAGSLSFLLLLWFGRRIGGPAIGFFAAGLFALMPLQVILSRLTLTDGMLGLFWFATLAFGFLSIQEPRLRRWPMLMWLAVALGLLTKGPLAWVPIGVLLVWLSLGGRPREIRALRLPTGMVLSFLPLLAWVLLAWHYHPDVLSIWGHEMLDRIVGPKNKKDLHPEPIWFFIPVFLAGLFPATLFMSLPGPNYSWKSAWAALRRGESACLWALAVVIPFVMFSLIKGKLMSYLLPLAAPMALLAAGVLVRRIQVRPDKRGAFVTIAFIVLSFAWLTGIEVVHAFGGPKGDASLLQQIEAKTGLKPPLRIVLLRNLNSAISYYNGRPVPAIDEAELPAWVARHPSDLIVITKEEKWKEDVLTKPEIAKLFKQEMTWPGLLGGSTRLVFRPVDLNATPTTEPEPEATTREFEDN